MHNHVLHVHRGKIKILTKVGCERHPSTFLYVPVELNVFSFGLCCSNKQQKNMLALKIVGCTWMLAFALSFGIRRRLWLRGSELHLIAHGNPAHLDLRSLCTSTFCWSIVFLNDVIRSSVVFQSRTSSFYQICFVTRRFLTNSVLTNRVFLIIQILKNNFAYRLEA